MKKPRFRLYKAVRKVLGADLTAAIFGYYLYEEPTALTKEKLDEVWKAIADQVDDSTTYVYVPTPEGWQCPRANCHSDVYHTHGTYPALKQDGYIVMGGNFSKETRDKCKECGMFIDDSDFHNEKGDCI